MELTMENATIARTDDATGMSDPLATARSVEWVGKNVKVEFELVADADAGPPAHN